MTSPNLYHGPSHPNPFEGVTLFDSYDEPNFVAEEGRFGETDWACAEAYPDGTTRVILRGAGDDRATEAKQNLRTGYDFASGLREEVDARITRGRDLLARHGYDLNQFPSGYPEVAAIVESAQVRPVQKAADLVPGKHYLYVHANRMYGRETPCYDIYGVSA
ncbi:MAG TPA: hypothetical protein VLF40_04360 [Candidatus Saccharimonadales bacterium]|nr:hypothetical protein [Candidatus Saccharimonadales bacterium]